MFGASSELAPNMFANMFGASSELDSVMEFGYKLLATDWASKRLTWPLANDLLRTVQLDRRQVQLQFYLCSANSGMHYYDTTKVTRTSCCAVAILITLKFYF